MIREAVAVAGVGIGLTLAGCAAADPAERPNAVRELSGVDRFDLDYVGGFLGTDDAIGDDCLKGTPDDPNGRHERTGSVIELDGKDGILVRSPVAGAAVLHLVGLSDGRRPLQPADARTSNQLKAYGCNLRYDE